MLKDLYILPTLNFESRPIQDCGLTVSGLTAKWSNATEENTLNNVSCSVKAGELLAVIGPVGSGKVLYCLFVSRRNLAPHVYSYFVRIEKAGYRENQDHMLEC